MKTCCIESCNSECDKGRRYCREHYLERISILRETKKNQGLKVRTLYENTCCNCKKVFQGSRKDQLFCSKTCFLAFNKTSKNPYTYDSKNYRNNLWEHRNIAENILNVKLEANEVVHHIDGDPKNNDVSNLLIMSRKDHASLHRFLERQRALLERSNNGNDENCWKTLIVPLTTTRLETTNVNVRKLVEIGQSAAEPLLNEEGSETMHVTSHADDDIVQTTTSCLDGIRKYM